MYRLTSKNSARVDLLSTYGTALADGSRFRGIGWGTTMKGRADGDRA